MSNSLSEMSNLITSMVIAGASTEEVECAIKHSMAVVNCEQSARDNGIAALVEKYQPKDK